MRRSVLLVCGMVLLTAGCFSQPKVDPTISVIPESTAEQEVVSDSVVTTEAAVKASVDGAVDADSDAVLDADLEAVMTESDALMDELDALDFEE